MEQMESLIQDAPLERYGSNPRDPYQSNNEESIIISKELPRWDARLSANSASTRG